MSSCRICPLSFVAAAVTACGLLTSGCDPRVSDRDLGTVIYDAKDLPGAGKDYDHPEMHAPGGELSTPDSAPAEAAAPEPDKGAAEPSAASGQPSAG